MIVHLDTSALIEAVAGERRAYGRLAELIHGDHRLAVSTIALYEWLRGPRTERELRSQADLLPTGVVILFGSAEAALAARLYRSVRRPRGRDLDLAIAACALVQGAALWTLNPKDFDDIPGLELI